MLSRLNAAFKAAKFGETAADTASSSQQRGAGIYFQGCCSNGAQVTEQCVLFEQFFRRDGQPIGDLGRAIEDFQNVIAERTVKLARGSVPRGQFDPAEAGVAFGADDVAFSHARSMHAARNRSKTIACCLN
jgi:hypothetical protein